MNQNNNEEHVPTKKEKAEQAGKDVAELAAKGAATYFGGPAGGAIADKVAQTKLGQSVLNKAGKKIAKNPVAKNALAKAQPAIQDAKPALNSAIGAMGGGAAGAGAGAGAGAAGASGLNNAANGAAAGQTPPNAGNGLSSQNPLDLNKGGKNNSGFGNNKSGLFSNDNSEEEMSGDFTANLKVLKTIISVFTAIFPFILGIVCIAIIVVIVVVPIMVTRDFITNLARQFTTGVEKLINFAEGNGWMTNEDAFFSYLDKEYNKYSVTVSDGSQLDVPLVAATIHYSRGMDFEAYEEKDPGTDSSYNDDSFSQIGSTVNKDQTVSFYYVAKEKLGSVNTLWPGQKRLLGHLLDTKISVEWVDVDAAGPYWNRFFNLFNQTIASTVDDAYWNTSLKYTNVFTAIPAFIDVYNEAFNYYNQHKNIFAGIEYDVRNLAYEAEEFLYVCKQLFDDSTGLEYKTNEETKETEAVPKEHQDGLFRLPVPVITRKMQYGLEEYKQMREDMKKMRVLLSEEGIDSSVLSREAVVEKAENSGNEKLKEIVENYKSNENVYMYSYTHYLQKVYVPFTYFYNKEYTLEEVDSIVEEIFEQRDFYKYLIGEPLNNSLCGGNCVYRVGDKEISNLKVRLVHCYDTDKVVEDDLDFEKYILGVTYAEIGDTAPIEAIKVEAIAARSFALTRPKVMGRNHGHKLEKENGNWVLTIKNCSNDQNYCDPDRGCYRDKNPGETHETNYAGANPNPDPGERVFWKQELPEDAPIRAAVNDVIGQVLLDADGNIIPTGYTNTEHIKWQEQARNGMDYTEILFAQYENAATILSSNCSRVCNAATGDFTQWKQGGSPWSNIVMSLDGETIGEIGCAATSVAIQIARSKVPLTIPELNPGTFVEKLKANEGFTDGGAIKWDAAQFVAPTFRYVDTKSIDLKGLTQTAKAQKIQSLINEGCYLVMQVKGCNNGTHYVAVDYVNGNDVYMMDPSTTNTNAWETYGAECSTQLVCYQILE